MTEQVHEQVYESEINGLPVRTGDIICTTDGVVTSGQNTTAIGRLWQALGYLVPGDVDHCALYLGPGGRCVEAGAKGVIIFDMPEGRWDSLALNNTRWLVDDLFGVAYPLSGRNLTPEDETRIRLAVANYCITQAAEAKPYNANFFDLGSEAAFYCSQLIYRAYIDHGIDLNTNSGHPIIKRISTIVFPSEIWNECVHMRYHGAAPPASAALE